MSDKIVFRYFGIPKNGVKHSGIICVASKLDKENYTINMAASFCSKKDVFNKKLARTIATGRLKSENSFIINLPIEEKLTHKQISDIIIKKLILLSNLPSWATKIWENSTY
jgi:hypothetical protein